MEHCKALHIRKIDTSRSFDEGVEDKPPPGAVPGRMRINAKPHVSEEAFMRYGDWKPCDYRRLESVQIDHAQWRATVLTA